MRLHWFFIVIVLLCCKGATANTQATYNPATWMHDLKDIIYDQSLLDITIPGTHDSGAYEFNNTLSPIDSWIVDDLIRLCAAFGVDIFSFIKNWSLTQDTTIYEQLVGGIRYLDLRACYVGHGHVGDWYTQHFLVGTKTQDLLNDIRKFLLESTGEIVVVELGELIPIEKELSLVNMIQNTLGQWLTPPMDLNKTTIRQMIEKDHRVIMLYPLTNQTFNFTHLWNKTDYIEGSYANKDRLAEMEKWNVGQINTYGGVGRIWELSWTLTTQDSDIIKTLLDPFLRTRTLKQFALEANSALDAWAKQYHNYMLGNILLNDFWELSNVVNLTISFNLRKCHDDQNLIAIDNSGLYCRKFLQEGDCNNPRYESWMKEHCKLSCGVC